MAETNNEVYAEFDEVVKTYDFVLTLIILCVVPFLGWVFLPLWLLGFGKWFCAESLRRLSCRLDSNSLKIKKGIFFRSEKNIPLDKITDITVSQGPLMRHYGVYTLKIETAGQNAGTQGSEGALCGIKDAKEFRNLVLQYRDRLSLDNSSESIDQNPISLIQVLQEISATLKIIENKISNND
ncbi:MAG: PH domain-containing protein [Phycisphaerae bacterium]|nr:PH domain-containing protein [Phycisphaerae bacterium]